MLTGGFSAFGYRKQLTDDGSAVSWLLLCSTSCVHLPLLGSAEHNVWEWVERNDHQCRLGQALTDRNYRRALFVVASVLLLSKYSQRRLSVGQSVLYPALHQLCCCSYVRARSAFLCCALSSLLCREKPSCPKVRTSFKRALFCLVRC